jgi:MoxR-like ATPase
MNGAEVLAAQATVREVAAAPEVSDYAVRLVLATHPEIATSPEAAKKYLRWGSSPRGAQALLLAGKVQALIAKRYNVSFHDIQRVALDVLRHRVALSFEAEADGWTEDRVLKQIFENVEVPKKALVG